MRHDVSYSYDDTDHQQHRETCVICDRNNEQEDTCTVNRNTFWQKIGTIHWI